jgi:hypothetical protein
MTDSADLAKMISDALRVAKSRKLASVVYLLELAKIELAKTGDVPARPVSEPKKHGSFGRRRHP